MRMSRILLAVAGLVAGLTAGTPALAEIPGPFVCSLGDSEAILTATEDAAAYAGTFRLAGDYAGRERGEPEVTILQQSYDGWRFIYANDAMTMVIAGDSATLYGDFGQGECFASRSTPVGGGWQNGSATYAPVPAGEWQAAGRGDAAWNELGEDGEALTWGGNVRAGPGEEFGRVTGVRMGVSVTILARTDRTWLDEFPWFKVRLPGGRVGYIAGGLLCTTDNRAGFHNARDCQA